MKYTIWLFTGVAMVGLCLCLPLRLQAQDPQLSQFYNAPLFVNPAFAGATYEHRFVANYRTQWPSLPQAFNTAVFSYDFNMPYLNSGLGLVFTNDRAGTVGLQNTSVSFVYAYKVRLAGKWVLSPAVSFGYAWRRVDFSRLVFGDQLDFQGGSIPTQDPSLQTGINARFFDFGSGLLLYNDRLWLGLSAYHLNRPNQSFTGGNARLAVRAAVHGGYRIPLLNDVKNNRLSSITPAFIYRRQGQFDQLDVGLQFHYNPIMVGFWYRGLPVQQVVNDNTNHDAVTFVMGLRFAQLQVGYSYDITVSRLGANSGGAHEISVLYQFNGGKQKVTRKQKFIPCPNNAWNLWSGQ